MPYTTSFTTPSGETQFFECDGFVLINVKTGDNDTMTAQTNIGGLEYTQIARAFMSASVAVYMNSVEEQLIQEEEQAAKEDKSKHPYELVKEPPEWLKESRSWLVCPECGCAIGDPPHYLRSCPECGEFLRAS